MLLAVGRRRALTVVSVLDEADIAELIGIDVLMAVWLTCWLGEKEVIASEGGTLVASGSGVVISVFVSCFVNSRALLVDANDAAGDFALSRIEELCVLSL